MFLTDQLASHPWLHRLIYEPELTSTNDVALRLAGTELPDTKLTGAVLVLTENQTAGRGRGANRWWSGSGALTFSLVVDLADEMPSGCRAQLALVAGLAVRDAIAELVCGPVEVKWPNDVYLAGRKVCGILIETTAARPRRAVIGIGINVNNSLTHAPDDVRSRATALIDHATGPLDRSRLLWRVLDLLGHQISRWERQDLVLQEAWAPHCYLHGRTVQLEAGGRSWIGRCLGISPTGALRLQTAEGPVELTSGVITRIDSAS